jgi:serine/threonine protein kinase
MEEIFDELRDKKHIVISILEAYTHLLKGIEYLVDLKIVHFDLKSDNVLYDSDMNHANIIDFGLSIPIDKITRENIKEYFYLYAPEYYLWPLEIHIINYLLHVVEEGEEATDIAERIAEEYVSSNKGLEMFSKEFAKSFQESCRRQVEQVLGDFEEDSYKKIVKGLIENYATWDNYAVSIMTLRLIYLLFPDGFPENRFYIVFTQLLLTNIHPDPAQRTSVLGTRQRFYELFYLNENIDTYIKMIEDITLDVDRVKSLVSSETETLNSAIEKTD